MVNIFSQLYSLLKESKLRCCFLFCHFGGDDDDDDDDGDDG